MLRSVKCSTGEATKSLAPQATAGLELGTGYGKEVAMHTQTTTFERATEAPAMVLQIQYAVREVLISWNVPVHETAPTPDAFPASAGVSVPAPPGWRPR